jgi:hypothetical protein
MPGRDPVSGDRTVSVRASARFVVGEKRSIADGDSAIYSIQRKKMKDGTRLARTS